MAADRNWNFLEKANANRLNLRMKVRTVTPAASDARVTYMNPATVGHLLAMQ